MSMAGNKLKNIGNRMRYMSLAATGAGVASVVAFSKIEDGLLNVQGLLEREDLPKYTGKLKELQMQAIKTGFVIEDANKGLFDTVSALGIGEQSIKTFQAAQKLAIGGAADLSVAVDGLTSIVNAYGRKTTSVTDVANAFYSSQVKGKCFAKGTEILMFDGTSKKVEEIKVGDKIMGDDNKPRNIKALGTGKETMYKITMRDKSSYVVNESHILSLKRNYRDGTFEILNISVKDYLQKSDDFKNRYFGYKTGIELKEKDVIIDPYFLGLWLGDGHSGQPRITTMDDEIVNYIKEQCLLNGWLFKTYEMEDNKAKTYSFSSGRKKNVDSRFWNMLSSYNLQNNKHIPKEYKINSQNVRLQLLAGLIDTDGYLNTINKCYNYEYATKSEVLKDDVLWLARSCGFYASAYEKIINDKVYYRIYISGDLHKIPCKIKRKICPNFECERCDVLTQRISVEEIGEDNFYGFEIDGNRLFVLNNFTVTHNTTVSELASEVGKVAPIAKAAGVGFKELLATTAALTTGGLRTDMATTALRAALSALAKPGAQARKILERLGIAHGRTQLKAVGLKNVLLQIIEANKKYPEALDVAIPNIRAATGLFALNAEKIALLDETLLKVSKDIENGTGLQDSYDRKMKATAQTLKKLRGNLSIMGNIIGSELAPFVSKLNSGLTKLTNWFLKLDPVTRKVIIGIGALIAIVTPLTVSLGFLAIAIGAITAPMLIVTAIIAASITAIAGLIYYWDEYVGYLEQAYNWYTKIMSIAQNSILDFFGFGNNTKMPEIKTENRTISQSSNKNEFAGKLDVNLNAPKETIKNYSSVTEGAGFNLGVNMGH
jgi:hypothetical protein